MISGHQVQNMLYEFKSAFELFLFGHEVFFLGVRITFLSFQKKQSNPIGFSPLYLSKFSLMCDLFEILQTINRQANIQENVSFMYHEALTFEI